MSPRAGRGNVGRGRGLEAVWQAERDIAALELKLRTEQQFNRKVELTPASHPERELASFNTIIRPSPSYGKTQIAHPNFTAENIEKLAALFPSCTTDARDEELKRAIDFDQLRQELSDHVVEGPRERYQLDWPGKREALFAANAPIAKTLRPCREESVDFDTTKNLFIEGDNLDALKLLQETYLGK